MFVTEPAALTRLKSIDPDTMSPLEALSVLYELKKLAKQGPAKPGPARPDAAKPDKEKKAP